MVQAQSVFIPSGGAANPGVNGFRLSPVDGVAVPAVNVANATEVFAVPHKGSAIALYNGSRWVTVWSPGASYVLAGRTAGLPFDLFYYLSPAGLALEAEDWFDATTRNTALVKQYGVWLKSGDTTRRYAGTCRPRSATTYDWNVSGVDGQSGPVRFDLWNNDNRVAMSFTLYDSEASHPGVNGVLRQWDGNTGFQVELVAGLKEESFVGRCDAFCDDTTNFISRYVTWGYDSTIARDAESSSPTINILGITPLFCSISKQPDLGSHYFAWLESTNSATTTWYGLDALGTRQSLCSGVWTC